MEVRLATDSMPSATYSAPTGPRDAAPPDSEQSQESDESHGLGAGDQAARTEVAIRSVPTLPTPGHGTQYQRMLTKF